MASLELSAGTPSSARLLAKLRRFIRWLTTPHVLLSLIMLVLLYFMVIIPIYRMVETTSTGSRAIRSNFRGLVSASSSVPLCTPGYRRSGEDLPLFTHLDFRPWFRWGEPGSGVNRGSLAWVVIPTGIPGRKVSTHWVFPLILPS